MRSVSTFVPPIVLRCLSRGQLVEQPLASFRSRVSKPSMNHP
jgi:hypothetical protein